MLFDVNGAGTDAALAALLGSTSDTLGAHPATVFGRVRLFARNLLQSGEALYPDLAGARPNPDSCWPASDPENLRSPETGITYETSGHFAFSSEINKGYEMAVEGGGDIILPTPANLRIQDTDSPATLNVDVSGLTATDMTDLLDQIEALIDAEFGDSVTDLYYSDSRVNITRGLFPPSWEIVVSGDANSAWPLLGFLTNQSYPPPGYIYTAAVGPGFFGNWRFRITDTSSTEDIDIRDGSGPGTLTDSDNTLHVRDPYLVASRLQALLRASALDNAASYTVTYDGWRHGRTNKFTVANPAGPFSIYVTTNLDPANGWPTLGFTEDHLGGFSYTSDHPAIHSEESGIIKLASPVLAFDRTHNARIETYRHLILDSNFYPADQTDPFPRVAYNLRITNPVNGVPVVNIDITGKQFATKDALATWIAEQLEDLCGVPSPFNVNEAPPDGLEFFRNIGATLPFEVTLTGDDDTAWALLGFPADVDDMTLLTGADFDLDALNRALGTGITGADKIVVYFAADPDDLEAAPDSDFEDGVDMFTFWVDAQLGVSWGTDAAGWARVGTPLAGHDLFPARFLWADFLLWAGETLGFRYLRWKVVNRQNPAGRMIFGQWFVGPALVNVWNVKADAGNTVLDRSTLERTTGGAHVSKYRRAGKVIEMSSDSITKEEAHVLEAVFLDARKNDSTQPHGLVPSRELLVSKVSTVWIHDPANPSGFIDSVAKAYGLVRGRITDFDLKPSGRLGQGFWEIKLTVEGER